MGKGVVVITWVDDLLINGRTEEGVTKIFDTLVVDRVKSHRDGTAEGYPCLKVDQIGNKSILSQPGLMKRIVDALGLSTKFSTAVSTLLNKLP